MQQMYFLVQGHRSDRERRALVRGAVRIQPGSGLLRCDGERRRQGYRKAQRRNAPETPDGPACECLNWRHDPAGRQAFLNGKGFAE
jgi:hypothetical protein